MSSNNRQMIFYLLVTYASKLSVSTLHTQVYQNSIIATGIFSVSFNSDWLQCIKNCMDSEDCVSYNFEVSGIDSLCELSRCGLPITTGCTKKALRFANGFVYQQLKIPMKVRFNYSFAIVFLDVTFFLCYVVVNCQLIV